LLYDIARPHALRGSGQTLAPVARAFGEELPREQWRGVDECQQAGQRAGEVYAVFQPVTHTATKHAAAALGVLLTIPAFVALIGSGAELLPIIAVGVGPIILAALAFPLALIVTKRKPAEPDQSVFD
jgi:hypothetical protein